MRARRVGRAPAGQIVPHVVDAHVEPPFLPAVWPAVLGGGGVDRDRVDLRLPGDGRRCAAADEFRAARQRELAEGAKRARTRALLRMSSSEIVTAISGLLGRRHCTALHQPILPVSNQGRAAGCARRAARRGRGGTIVFMCS